MTSTTERQQFEEWFTNKYPRSYWGVEKTASGEYQGGLAAPLWEAWQESRGCMANREAQPVAWASTASLKRGDVREVWPNGEQHKAGKLCITALYTATPAPAVPEEAKLGEMPFLGNSEPGYVRGWNDCRAAMLAQPVSSGYTLPDNVREALTLALQAMEFMGDALNNIDAVCTEDVEYVTPAFNAVRELLAAAPEGGNDHDTRR